MCLQVLWYAAHPLSRWLSAENLMWAALRLPPQILPWEIPPPSFVKHLSVETKSWLASFMRATPNLKRLWSPTHRMGSPINTTHPCTMPHAMPWHASSGKNRWMIGQPKTNIIISSTDRAVVETSGSKYITVNVLSTDPKLLNSTVCVKAKHVNTFSLIYMCILTKKGRLVRLLLMLWENPKDTAAFLEVCCFSEDEKKHWITFPCWPQTDRT